MERVIEVAPLAVGAGAVDSSGCKAKHPGVFVDFLRNRQRFLDFYQSSVDKVDKVEWRWRLAP